ncbi:MAG: HDOD domain-containing protein [Gammaproteobacteria bacterium]|nr:HDOD domain-containing protein [Gammaproteobacteria bacterium]
MISGLNSWLDQLADKKIPILKQQRDQTLAILNDEGRSASECRAIILTDPGMAANLLKVMNRSRLKEGRLEITTISSVISLFGVSRLRDEIHAMTCLQDMDLAEANQMGIQRCLKQSWYCEQFVMKWVGDRDVREPEEVQLAAILQCLPELMFWCYGGDVMPRIEHQSYYECRNYYDVVSRVLGCHKREIGAALAKKWCLPEIACFAFESSYDSYTNATAVGLAALLSRLCLHGWYGRDMAFFLQKAMHYFGENAAKTARHLHQQALDMAGNELALGYRPVASLLVASNLERHPEPEYYLASEQKPENKPQSKPQKPVVKEASDVDASGLAAKRIDPLLLSRDLEQFKKLLKQQAKMNELLKHVILSLHDTLQFGRVSFLLLSADKLKLEAKITKSSNAKDDSFGQLTIELKKQSLFSLLMNKPQAFSLNKNNYEKYWALISGKTKTDIQVDRFCAAAIFYGSKALGVIYADKPQADISTEDFKAFQQLTMLLNKGLDVLSKNKK